MRAAQSEPKQPRQVGTTTELLTLLFTEWRASEIPYIVLRNYDELPQQIGNDLDILVCADHRSLAEHAIIKVARTLGYTLANRAEFSPVSLFFSNPENCQQVQVDLFTNLRWRGFDILRPEALLTSRRSRGVFFIPQPIHEASLNLLTRLLYHGYVKEKYKPQIKEAYKTAPEEARRILAEPLGKSAARQLVAYVQDEDWAAIEARTGRWRRRLMARQLIRSPRRPLLSMMSDARRLIMRFIAPPGLMLAVLGPDGCGKSSLAAGVMDALSPMFAKEKSAQFHWKPSLFPRVQANTKPVAVPHGKPPRSRLASLTYFGFHWLEFILGGLLRLRPVLFQNGLVIVDRYYHDFLVDTRRYRLNVPARLLKWAQRFVMEPDLIIYLDAPPEVLQSRKQEVSRGEAVRQRQAYLELALALPNAHVLDASRPLNEVIAEVEGLVLTYLTERTARGLELNDS